ncbi:50S ribosomal protein L11 methyltransferase [Thioalkalivibrio sp. XN279]|uniref:50S ribosomal protein L11 methyltransferase n=1 Tax=Thioalkalivibrio sp. XN279 TaxID=2714953 RepID=UPI0014099D80|nr:50S ribosomal protein L11 methyltransferase [Thioalkalivibrio sp. XN279]NHA16150.1 50S ribosomal protein L11 methyltransferase [Thioalkalivibrio sp. XN279]
MPSAPAHPDWLEVSATLPREQAETAEADLLAAGAMAVTLLDAEDQPVLEPLPGETPLWPTLCITGLFPGDADPLRILAELSQRAPGVAWRPSRLAGRAWEREWLRDFGPRRFGRRLAVVPGGQDAPEGSVVVRLDPGLAFGTGNHPTTALCLEWLDALAQPDTGGDMPLAGALVIDYGCGSGILAVAALKLGARSAVGVDLDPQALLATRENAVANDVAGQVVTCDPEGLDTVLASRKADILLANILAGPLHELLPEFAARLRPGGRLALSGILADQAAPLSERAATWFEIEQPEIREGWARLAGRRKVED